MHQQLQQIVIFDPNSRILGLSDKNDVALNMELDTLGHDVLIMCHFCLFKGAGGSADLKISKFALLSLNDHNLSNPEVIYTK